MSISGDVPPQSVLGSIINVRKFMDERPLTRFQSWVVGICTFQVVVSGFDAGAIAYVAPPIMKELHISRAAMGPVFSAAFVGMILGSLVLGPLADRYGRKPIMIASTVLVGVGALLTCVAHGTMTMIVYRMITGVGLGGTKSNSIALTVEYMPSRARARGTAIAYLGYTVGGLVAGYITAAILPHYGWRAVFFLGGVLPCVFALLCVQLMPESIGFLIIKGGKDKTIRKYLTKIDPKAAPELEQAQFMLPEQRAKKFLVSELFIDNRAKVTLGLWAIFFMSMWNLNFLITWIPSILHSMGMPVQKAILVTTMYQTGGLVCGLTIAPLIDRKRSYSALAWSFVGAAIFIAAIGLAGVSVKLLIFTVFGAGFFVIGTQTGSAALAADVYPTAIRGTGVGWAFGVGRVGSSAGPLIGGLLLSILGTPNRIFFVTAIPALLACAAASYVSKHAETVTTAKKAVAAAAGD